MAGSAQKNGLGYWWMLLLSPLSWTIGMRRLFLLTLPLSVPLYIAALLIMFVVMVAVAISVPIIAFWNAPQERLRSSGYNYGTEKKRRSRRKNDDQDDLPMGL